MWLARQGTPSTVAMKQIISFYIPDPHDFLGYMLHFYGFSSFELLVMFITTFFYLYKNTGGEPPNLISSRLQTPPSPTIVLAITVVHLIQRVV